MKYESCDVIRVQPNNQWNLSSGNYEECGEGDVEVNIEEQLLRKAHEVNLPDGTVQTIVQQVCPCQFDYLLEQL